MLSLGLSRADSKWRRPAASCCAAALCCGSGNGTHHEDNAFFHLSRCSLGFSSATYFVKSKSKLLALWTAVFLISERTCTNRQEFSGKSSYAFINAILPFLRSFVSSFSITSLSFRLLRRVISRWFKAASTMACIFMTNVQSSSLFKLCSGERGMPSVRLIQSSKYSERRNGMALPLTMPLAILIFARVAVFYFTPKQFVFRNRQNLLHGTAEFVGRLLVSRYWHWALHREDSIA